MSRTSDVHVDNVIREEEEDQDDSRPRSGNGAVAMAVEKFKVLSQANLLDVKGMSGSKFSLKGNNVEEAARMLHRMRTTSGGENETTGTMSTNDMRMSMISIIHDAGIIPLSEDEKKFMHACRVGDLASIKAMIEAESEYIDKKDFILGYNALHWACKNGNLEVAHFLVSQGADIKTTTNGMYTPLHLAAIHNQVGVCRLLLNLGADPHMRDASGRTPRDYANHHLRASVFKSIIVEEEQEEEAKHPPVLAHGHNLVYRVFGTQSPQPQCSHCAVNAKPAALKKGYICTECNLAVHKKHANVLLPLCRAAVGSR
eukprot:Colp12_sorted_trinity150504_noHs@23835